MRRGDATPRLSRRDARRAPRSLAVLSCLLGLLSPSAFFLVPAAQAEAMPPHTELVSVGLDGAPANGEADRPQISRDGRYVVFDSVATNLSTDAVRRNVRNVYRRDLVAGVTRVVSIGLNGVSADNWSSYGWASADGRYVAFASDATNLVAGGTSRRNVFVRDMETGVTQRISVNNRGEPANLASTRPMISPNGRFIAFNSQATNLSPLATNAKDQVYLRDLVAGTTTLVSVSASGTSAGNALSYRGMVSDDGRMVAWAARANNLVANDTNGAEDIFLRDMQAGSTVRVNLTPSGEQLPSGGGARPYLSPDGRWLTYNSYSALVDPTDKGTKSDVFLYDVVNRTSTRASVGLNGADGTGDALRGFVSDDGRYVVFNSFSSNLVGNDTNGTGDCFLRDMATGVTTRISLAWHGGQPNGQSFRPVPSFDGGVVTYKSLARNLVRDDPSADWQIYAVRPLGLAPGGDKTAPTVTVTTPTAASTVQNHGVKLSGIASDDVGVDSVQIRLRNTTSGQYLQPDGSWSATSTPITVSLGARYEPSTSWSYIATLPNGSYGFSTTVWDTNRNQNAVKPYRNFKVNAPPDSESPTVTIESPSTTTAVTSRVVTMSGQAVDSGGTGAGISRVLLSVRNNATGAWLAADGSWTSTQQRLAAQLADAAAPSTGWSFSSPLADGAYTLLAMAVDNSGNESVTPAASTFSVDGPDPDTTKPSATFTSPADGEVSTTSRVRLSGTATDPAGDLAGVDVVEVRIRQNSTGLYQQDEGDFGPPATRLRAHLTDRGSFSTGWEFDAELPTGSYVVTWFAIDKSGNESDPVPGRTITVDNADRVRPTAQMTTPSAGASTAGSPLTLTGQAADEGGELAGVAAVYIVLKDVTRGKWLQANGSWGWVARRVPAQLTAANTTSTGWSLTASAPAGSYEATIVVVDISKNENDPQPTAAFSVS